MKIVKDKVSTVFYPYITPGGEHTGRESHVVARTNGTVKLVWSDAPVMTPQSARLLAEALLHAVEVAEKGRE